MLKMPTHIVRVFSWTGAILCLSGWVAAACPASGLVQVAPDLFPQLYTATDTCNVYVLKVGEKALLIDLGDGTVVDQLQSIGVNKIDWVLFTHHHREQCQGIGRIDRVQTQVAVPETEQDLFEKPHLFRKWKPNLSDRYSVYCASYVRPPRKGIPVDKLLRDNDVVAWEGFQIRCVHTPGHSPGSMTFLISHRDQTFAFTGDLMHDGAQMVTWFDTEWDYGFASGLDTLIKSIERITQLKFDRMLPSHGPVIRETKQLTLYRDKLKALRSLYVRGYPVFDQPEHQRDTISKPTKVSHLKQVTAHLYKLSDAAKGRNFAMIIADSGNALVLDCGLFPETMLEEIIFGARQHLGLKKIEAFWISHMHGDHFLLGPAMKQKYGAEAWTLDRIADRCEHPERYDYAALINSYDDGCDGMKIDKTFYDGESISWEGYRIQVDWMPGQTEFGCCLWLEIDGKKIAFTGDNLFGYPADTAQNGHEAVVARNSAILEEGYVYGSKYLLELNPDIVMGSHSYVMDKPRGFLERYHHWSKDILKQYQLILPGSDYQYAFDPYWVSAYPYRTVVNSNQPSKVSITIRNFHDVSQAHRVVLKLPAGVTAIPPVLEGSIDAKQRETYDVMLSVDEAVAEKRDHIGTFDITLDGEHHGELFDFLMRIP